MGNQNFHTRNHKDINMPLHHRNLTFSGNPDQFASDLKNKRAKSFGHQPSRSFGQPAVPTPSTQNQNFFGLGKLYNNEQCQQYSSSNQINRPLAHTGQQQTQLSQNETANQQSVFIEPSPGTYGSRFYMENIINVYNEELKDIFQVRVNPILTIGALKQRIAFNYKVEPEDIVIIFGGVRYDSKPQEVQLKLKTTRRKVNKVSRTPSPTTAASKLRPQQYRKKSQKKPAVFNQTLSRNSSQNSID